MRDAQEENLFIMLDGDVINSKEVSFQDASDSIFVSETNQVYYYLGYQNKRKDDADFFHLSKYAKANRDEEVFIRLEKGALLFDCFFESYRPEGYKIKKIDKYRVILPDGGTSTYFGVYANEYKKLSENVSEQIWVQNKELERALFGVTYDQLNELLKLFSSVFFSYHEYSNLPRVTRSNKRSNRCDLTGNWIPQNFPYIAFESSEYEFSHVSLNGFYKYLSFLCKDFDHSSLYSLLLKQGADKYALNLLIKSSSTRKWPIRFNEINF